MEPEVLELIKKENNLLRFRKNGVNQDIYILGTIHEYHLHETSDYSFAELQSAIDAIKPDILMIETRQETLDEFNAVDGPIEMIFARSYAAGCGIPVKGIDWWRVPKDREDLYNMDIVRDDKMYEYIIAGAAGYKTVVALMGATHRTRMPERFLKNGYEQVKVDDSAAYFGSIKVPFKYPQSMVDEMNKKIEYGKTGLVEEVKRYAAEGDELYNHWMDITQQEEIKALRDEMVIPNKLYREKPQQ